MQTKEDTSGCPDHDVLMSTTGTPVAHLLLDQDMEDFDLEAALEGLPDHAIVQLGPITLRLIKPATLTKPLTLRGSGLDRTRIVCQTSALGGVLNFQGDGPWVLSHLSVERVKAETLPEDVRRRCVLVEGQIDITGCRFLGAPGAGLFLGGQSRGLVTQCEARDNQAGIILSGRANLHLQDNACSGNRSDGIRYVGHSGGLAQGNRCENNQGHGIRVGDQATPTLADNHCLQNDGCGILCSANATANAKGNLCCGNGLHGISVIGRATPSLEVNHCLHNKISGIAYYGSAGGDAKMNHCSQNDWFGIQVSGKATPTLEGNHCLHNRHTGLVYSSSAAGTAKGNECSNNARYGIFVTDQAAPILEANHCSWNKLARIFHSAGAAGTAPPPPPPQPHLVLDRDMTNFDLEAALDRLPDHAVVQLGAITLRLKSPAFIRRPLTLRGSGQAQTRIVCESTDIGGVLNFQGEGPWVLSDLTVERVSSRALENDSWRSCVGVAGEIQATRCRFLGAPGTGLILGHRSRGLVSHCEAINNLVGISVSDNATTNLKDNVCQSNRSVGIRYLGNSGGLAQGNRCENNQTHGIFVGDQAAPTLEANQCSWNKQNGIAYLRGAAGSARENKCSENDGCGFQIGDLATPTLEANHCLRNKGSGIVYYGSATGITKGNDCSENAGYGIFVGGLANPTVDANRCWGNKSGGPSPSWPR